ncbi:MAG: hypothetical protein OXC15_17905, partial [Rhodospirillaceae bacterium]|nr:hypothetical protein [Rhodospirillaceae bacterium]
MKKSKVTRSLLAACSIVALSAVMYGCVHSGDSAPPPVVEPEPSAYEAATAAIAAATTAAAAQAAYDAVKDDVTAAQGAMLQAKVDARIAALMTMADADAQKMALMTAAGNIDTSDLSDAAAIAAANNAIAALKMALAAATDVSDADKAMYQGQVTAAETAVATAQSALDHAAQTMALSEAVTALQAIDLGDLSSEGAIDAAEAAIASVQMALDAATELSDAEKAVAMTLVATANRTVMAAQGRMDVAGQIMALSDAVAALEMVDLDNLMTQAQIDAANAAIIALDLALAAADDLTDAQKLDALTNVTLAKRKVTAAETALAENVGSQRMALTEAGTALAAIDLDDLDTAEKITAANDAVAALKMALDGATHLSDAAKMMYQTQLDTATETVRTAQTGMDKDGRMMTQRTAVMDAVTMARTAVGMVDDDATDAQVTAADDAVTALKAAIDGAVDLAEGDTDVAMAKGTLATLEGQLASAKTSRMAAMDEAERMKNEGNAATAAKLHAGISAQMGAGDGTTFAVTDRDAFYNTAGTAISVSIGDGGDTAPTEVTATLSEDKKTMVADNHGWTGQKFTAEPDNDGTYEAMVYSKVGEPEEGAKFNAGPDDGGYTLNAADAATNPGELPITGDVLAATARIASSSFDQSAGTKEFELPANTMRVVVPGSYHGVSGTYYCTAAASSTCAVQLAEDGFNLGGTADADNAFTATGGTWTFKPTNPEARVMSTPDSNYASYGWWLHMSEDGMTYTASAFADDRGTVGEADGITDLRGSATYMGGAAGKYALSSSTGGTNDAGHFTARATLEADFNEDMISG